MRGRPLLPALALLCLLPGRYSQPTAEIVASDRPASLLASWTALPDASPGVAPSPRHSHTLTPLGRDGAVMIGGFGHPSSGEEKESSASYIHHSDAWLLAFSENPAQTAWHLLKPDMGKDVPAPRQGHSAVEWPSGTSRGLRRVIIFGGRGAKEESGWFHDVATGKDSRGAVARPEERDWAPLLFDDVWVLQVHSDDRSASWLRVPVTGKVRNVVLQIARTRLCCIYFTVRLSMITAIVT